jgi:hypothetical protein
MPNNALTAIKNFDLLPNDAVLPTKATALILGLSERTVRKHPSLPRIYVSADRYGQRISDIRRLAREGVPPAKRRVRVGPRATRIVQEVASAVNRAEAERILARRDLAQFSTGERERLDALLKTQFQNFLATRKAAKRAAPSHPHSAQIKENYTCILSKTAHPRPNKFARNKRLTQKETSRSSSLSCRRRAPHAPQRRRAPPLRRPQQRLPAPASNNISTTLRPRRLLDE